MATAFIRFKVYLVLQQPDGALEALRAMVASKAFAPQVLQVRPCRHDF